MSGTNPYLQNADTLKRLGDGFYEQKLVTDQIIAATGQRFVGDYTDNETQYKALLTAGATFAQQYGLQIGTPLSDEQMKHLTSDMVWLVDQTVTLPDGSTQTVLVPQVYLVVQDGDLKGDGTLMAGRNTTLQASGTITNTGTVGSRDATIMVADNIINSSAGTIQGSYVNLNARQDLNNIAALIKGDTVALQAGRDVNLTSTTASTSSSLGQTNTWSTFVSGVSQIDAGSLAINAGHDLNLTAAAVNASSNAFLQAGNDINLLMVQTEQGESVVFKKKNNSEVVRTSEVGSTIKGGSNLSLKAGQDVNAIAANVSAGGQLAVGAGRDINLLAGEATGQARDEHYQKSKGHWGGTSSSHSIDAIDWTQTQGSTFTGDSAVFLAGRDLSVISSNIGASNDVLVSADRDITIAAAGNTSADSHYLYEKKSGWGALGGISYGSKERTDTLDGTTVFHSASTVGSVHGDVLINAGRGVDVLGSNVLAREGDIGITGQAVTIASVTDTNKEKEYHEIKSSGFSVNVGSPIIDAINTAARMVEDMSETDNPIMKALALGTAGLAGVNAYDQVQRPGKKGGGAVTLTLDYGVSKSSSTTDRESSSVVGSTVAAGNNITIVSRGAGQDSDINVLGSSISAGNNAILQADGDIRLQAAANTASQHTDSESFNASIGGGIMAGVDENGSMGYGFIARFSTAGSLGHENGSQLGWTNSSVTAGNILALQSGGDTTLIGATGKANQILASVGGNLLLRSLQDKNTYDSDSKNFSAGFTYCYGYCSSSGYASYGQGTLDSNFETVTSQTGLWSGDGGFQIDVKGNTSLVGSVIASSDKAIADGLNKLTTGTLLTDDIKNTAHYNGYQASVGGSTDFSNWSSTAGIPTFAFAFDNAHSTTKSAISGADITISDAAGQQALTGKTVAETIASLNRDTSDTLNSLDPIFDKEKIQAGFDIVSEATQQVGTYVANRAREADEIKKALAEEVAKGDSADSARLAQLNSQYEQAKQWLPGGRAREAVTILVAAAAGNVTGSIAEFAQSAALNYLQAEGAQQIKGWLESMSPGPEREATRAALQALLACGTSAGKGGSCGSGAAGAGISSVVGSILNLIKPTNAASAQEVEALNNLMTGLAGAVVGSLGGDAVTAAISAKIEAENNNFYRHRTAIAQQTKPLRESLDLGVATGQISPQEYKDSISALDASAARIDALMTIYQVNSAAGLSQMVAQMSPSDSTMFGEAIADILPLLGAASSAYQFLTGETPATKEEANRFFALLGIVPGAKIAEGVDRVRKVVQIAEDVKLIEAARRVAKNREAGSSFEEAVLKALDETKNKISFSVTVGDRLVTVIPDGILESSKILEIKDVAYLSRSPQFRAYAELVAEGGIVKTGADAGVSIQFTAIDLIVSPGARISRPLQELIRDSRGSITVLDPITKQRTPWTP